MIAPNMMNLAASEAARIVLVTRHDFSIPLPGHPDQLKFWRSQGEITAHDY